MRTTLTAIRAHQPCRKGWLKLLSYLGKREADDEPLSILTILESNGLSDAIWALCAVRGCDRELRLLAVAAARRVAHLLIDPRSLRAISVAERYARGEATGAELKVAQQTAREAMAAMWAAERRQAVREVGRAKAAATAYAELAAFQAAGERAWEAAEEALHAAAGAAAAAVDEALHAASAREAERRWQAAELRRVCAEVEAHIECEAR